MNDHRPWYSLIDLHNRLSKLPPPLKSAGHLAHRRCTRYLPLTLGVALTLSILQHDWNLPAGELAAECLFGFALGASLLICVSLRSRLQARKLDDATAVRQSANHPATLRLLTASMVVVAVMLSVTLSLIMLSVRQTGNVAGSVSFLLVSLSALLFGDCLEVLIYCLSKTPPRSRAPLPDLLNAAKPALS